MRHSMRPPVLALLALAAIGLSACAGSAAAGLEPGARTIYMAAIEPKGGTTADSEPFPAATLPGGGGYLLKEPDETGRWEVSTYRWSQNEIVAVEGDTLTLEILGVNGASHPSRIEGYDISFEVKRGELTEVTFTADKPGIYRFICDAHQPSMTGQLVVLPKG